MVTVGLIVFYYLAAASIASAILAVTRRQPIHSMLWVLALFLHVAGIFLLLGAEFLAAVQVIVYAGAILVFYLFFLMLLDLSGEAAAPRFSAHWPIAVAAGIVLATLLWLAQDVQMLPPAPAAAMAIEATTGSGATSGTLDTVGTILFIDFALPFEIVSIVLLAAIVGAVVMAKRKTES